MSRRAGGSSFPWVRDGGVACRAGRCRIRWKGVSKRQKQRTVVDIKSAYSFRSSPMSAASKLSCHNTNSTL